MDGKTKYYKDGNPEHYRWFTDVTWKNMTDREKAMWTLYNENEPAPIPKDVLEFKKKHGIETINLCPECEKLRKEIKALREEIDMLHGRLKKPDKPVKKIETKGRKTVKIDLDVPGQMTEETEKKLIQKELKKLKVKFNWNTGLPKLKEKLKEAQDANNTE